MDLKQIDWIRNLWKSLFMSFSIGFLSLITYGFDTALLVANLIVTTVLTFVSCTVIDGIYYYLEKKKELEDK